MEATAISADPSTYCDERLKLRHQIQKLYWMGLDGEAEHLAREIEGPERTSQTASDPRTVNTLSCC